MEVSTRARRNRPRVSYKEPSEADVYYNGPLQPQSKPRKSNVYPIEVVDEDSLTSTVKVHYIGYSKIYDEWKAKGDIIDLGGDLEPIPEELGAATQPPFSLYHDLASKSKASLTSGRKESPISLSF